MSTFLDKMKHMVVEDDKPTESPAVPAPSNVSGTVTMPTAYVPSTPQAPAQSLGGDDAAVYEKIQRDTSFDQLPTIQKILTFAKPLEQYIPDPATRLKAAFTQAAVDLPSVMSDIDRVRQQLSTAIAQFNAKIDSHQKDISADEQKSTQLEQQLRDLRVSIVDRRGKLDHASAAFTAATQRRQTEIDQLQQQFSAVK